MFAGLRFIEIRSDEFSRQAAGKLSAKDQKRHPGSEMFLGRNRLRRQVNVLFASRSRYRSDEPKIQLIVVCIPVSAAKRYLISRVHACIIQFNKTETTVLLGGARFPSSCSLASLIIAFPILISRHGSPCIRGCHRTLYHRFESVRVPRGKLTGLLAHIRPVRCQTSNIALETAATHSTGVK